MFKLINETCFTTKIVHIRQCIALIFFFFFFFLILIKTSFTLSMIETTSHFIYCNKLSAVIVLGLGDIVAFMSIVS